MTTLVFSFHTQQPTYKASDTRLETFCANLWLSSAGGLARGSWWSLVEWSHQRPGWKVTREWGKCRRFLPGDAPRLTINSVLEWRRHPVRISSDWRTAWRISIRMFSSPWGWSCCWARLRDWDSRLVFLRNVWPFGTRRYSTIFIFRLRSW